MAAKDYNDEACMERHLAIEHRFRDTQAWLEKLDKRLWGLVVIALVQLLGILVLLLTTS